MTSKIPRDAYVLIIGAMKCGTTSLFDYLARHPQICPSRPKEPEFFSEHQQHGRLVERYGDLWTFDAAVHRYVLEASSGYTKSVEKNVARNIHEYGISPRFIYIIRNPFDRIVSHYNYMQLDSSWRLNITDPHLVDTSNYFLQLKRYREYFPAESILLLDFDELKKDPQRLLGKAYSFLDLPEHFPEHYEVRNPTRADSGIERKLRRSKLRVISEYMPPALKQAGRKILRMISPPKMQSLTQAEREVIYDKLKDDMARLHQEYGFDVRKWGFEA